MPIEIIYTILKNLKLFYCLPVDIMQLLTSDEVDKSMNPSKSKVNDCSIV